MIVEDEVLFSRPKIQMFYDDWNLVISLKSKFEVVCHNFLYSLKKNNYYSLCNL